MSTSVTVLQPTCTKQEVRYFFQRLPWQRGPRLLIAKKEDYPVRCVPGDCEQPAARRRSERSIERNLRTHDCFNSTGHVPILVQRIALSTSASDPDRAVGPMTGCKGTRLQYPTLQACLDDERRRERPVRQGRPWLTRRLRRAITSYQGTGAT